MRTFLIRTVHAALLFVLASACFAQSNYKNIQIQKQPMFGYPPCEPSIAIDPNNTNHLIGGSILDRVYISENGGENWEIKRLESKYGVYGDPCVLIGEKGDAYYLHLSNPSGKGWSHPSLLDRIVCQRSKDGGYTWNDGGYMGLNIPKDQDKEWAVIHPKGRRIYCTWTQFDKYDSEDPEHRSVILFSRSNRRAKKWCDPVVISQYSGDCLDSDATVEGAVPAIGLNDELYVSWALNDTIFFDRSVDNGKTWLDEDIKAGMIAGGWDMDIPGISRCNGMPVTRTDLSDGDFSGSIYINYSDMSSGEGDPDIWLIASRDGGFTWEEPVRVNDDGPGKAQFFPWMAVDSSTGHIYIVFYDRRNYDDLQTDVYLAVSSDGGRTFTNERISESPFIPSTEMFFGDYNNIDAVDGVVRPIWTRMDNGLTSIWTAIINK